VLTAFLWGMEVKRAGTKPLVLMSLAVACVSNFALGLAPSLGWALAIRFVSGLLICISATVKTIIAQSVPSEHQVTRPLLASRYTWLPAGHGFLQVPDVDMCCSFTFAFAIG
jgi:predicted MFS family arabinose efflux permease